MQPMAAQNLWSSFVALGLGFVRGIGVLELVSNNC